LKNQIAENDKYQIAWDASHKAGQEAAKSFYEVSGFAWIIIKPGNSSFAKWLVKTGRARSDHYYGGVNVEISEHGQYLAANDEYAHAFADELMKYFPKLTIVAMSREH
jgi:hypothetical protein